MFFFKLWGGVRKVKYGRELNGRTYDAMPPLSREPMPPLDVRREIARSLDTIAARWPTKPLIRVSSERVVA
jgi:hypothetical protein